MATTIDPRRLRDRPGGLAHSTAGEVPGLDRARAFAAARRHSFLVRTLRLALPLLALGVLGVYGATTWRIATLRSVGVTLEEVRISNDLLVMANPKYAGTGKDGSRHAVRARAAETDLLTQKLIKLTAIEGDITQLTGNRVDLTATRGTYDQESGVLELHEQIDVRSTDGMTAKLTAATVMTKENRIVSNEPITATNATSSIRARGMDMATQRRIATFTGDVAVRMTPPAADAANPKKEKPASSALGPSFSSNEPVDITSDRLVVDDGKRTAMFRTNVIARQGTATLAAPELDAYYMGRSALPGVETGTAAADPAASRLTKLEARGGVVMTRDADRATATSLHHDAEAQRTKLSGPVDMTSGVDRRATSAAAEIDHKADRITLDGSVVLYQGRNILRGERLAIDRPNGRARLDSPADAARGNGRINVILYRAEQPASRARAAAPAADASENGVIGAFRTDPNQPIDIDAAVLDFDETRRNAHFTGNVVAKQGEFVIRTPSLTAHFQGQTSMLLAAAPKGGDAAGATSLKKIEARNGVVITGKDGQKVTGDAADFDPVANFATVTGRVVVHQGKNVVEGSKLIMDLTSGRTRFENDGPEKPTAGPAPESTLPCVAGQTCTSKPRVRAVFYPKDTKRLPAARGEPSLGSAAPPAGQATGQPQGPRPASQSSWQSSTTRAPDPGAPQ
jgi:lipopolysaccharide transport protein LptA/LPS export ABC transporter protein LptC